MSDHFGTLCIKGLDLCCQRDDGKSKIFVIIEGREPCESQPKKYNLNKSLNFKPSCYNLTIRDMGKYWMSCPLIFCLKIFNF